FIELSVRIQRGDGDAVLSCQVLQRSLSHRAGIRQQRIGLLVLAHEEDSLPACKVLVTQELVEKVLFRGLRMNGACLYGSQEYEKPSPWKLPRHRHQLLLGAMARIRPQVTAGPLRSQ